MSILKPPQPGILNLVILESPKVISLDTVAEEGSAFAPITILLSPVVIRSPALYPKTELLAAPKAFSNVSVPTKVLLSP